MSLFTRAQLGVLSDILQDATRAEILPRFRCLAEGAIRSKTGPLDLVTDADEAAERMITARLQAEFPGCVVIGEEAASADARVLDGLMQADLAFVVDPVDGTSNFAAGMTLFGCMSAVLMRGQVVGTAIHDPIGRDTALALRGEGAWIAREDGSTRGLHVAAPVPVSEMNGGASWRFLPPDLGARVAANLPRVAGSFGYRCAAHEYRLLAGGGCHYLFYGRLYPWDHAPGWLLHQEAGGYSAHFDGSAYQADNIHGGLICTPDRDSWDALRAALLG
ncbi:MAG: inositol monophosphatase family protein [Acetobacteraceae bacterium]|nr:inositol monophosphatase family protein [Acetobacteraceae bacterium]